MVSLNKIELGVNKETIFFRSASEGGGGVELLWRIISSSKWRTTNILDYMAYIINYLNKRRVGGFKRDYMGIII